jgi:hypothetical protein
MMPDPAPAGIGLAYLFKAQAKNSKGRSKTSRQPK